MQPSSPDGAVTIVKINDLVSPFRERVEKARTKDGWDRFGPGAIVDLPMRRGELLRHLMDGERLTKVTRSTTQMTFLEYTSAPDKCNAWLGGEVPKTRSKL